MEELRSSRFLNAGTCVQLVFQNVYKTQRFKIHIVMLISSLNGCCCLQTGSDEGLVLTKKMIN